MKRRDFLKKASIGSAFLYSSGMYSYGMVTRKNEEGYEVMACPRTGSEIPVIDEVDVVIVGGSSGAVSAALSAKEHGAKVSLVTADPYLGEDVCGGLRLWDKMERLNTELAKTIYSDEDRRPGKVKRLFNKQLIDAEIPFLFSSFPSAVLYDKNGRIAGIVIANRSGEQVIRTKKVIDATFFASVARVANVEFTPFNAGKHAFRFVVVSESVKNNMDYRILDESVSVGVQKKNKDYKAIEYSLELDIEDDQFNTFTRAEQKIRALTWDRGQVDAADYFSWLSPNQISAKKSVKKVDIDNVDFDSFIPSGAQDIMLLNTYADVSRKEMARLNNPPDMMLLGEKMGAFVAQEVAKLPDNEIVRKDKKGESKEQVFHYHLNPMRDNHLKGIVTFDKEELPVWGRYDVVIAGGGTAGAPAGIGVQREGGKSLIIENLHGLGGTGTLGFISRYWDGFREGFTREVDMGVKELGGNHSRKHEKLSHWVREWKMEWFRRTYQQAGGEIWSGAVCCGALMEHETIKGVIVSTPHGKGVVMAHRVIDSTGSGDVAIAAGSDYIYTDGSTVAVQGAGVPPHILGRDYINTDWAFISDSDVFDITRSFVNAAEKFKNEYDTGKLLQVRERRRIVGDYQVSVLDVYNGRIYSDAFSYHISSFDTHGFTISNYFMLRPPEERHKIEKAYVPLRAMLPKGIKNIIVTGLGISAHRDALPVLRMQPCVQNQGYAAGLFSMMSIRQGKEYRKSDLSELQLKLVDIGHLAPEMLQAEDNFPPDISVIKDSLKKVAHDFDALPMLLWNDEKAIPMVKEAFQKAEEDQARLNYAFILGIYGLADGWRVLNEEIKRRSYWDEGWNYTGMGQFGMSMSYLDGLIIALGRTKKNEALNTILDKARLLKLGSEFSHFRAVSVALGYLQPTSQAADVFYDLLNMPGVKGHAVTSLKDAYFVVKNDWNDTSIRNHCLIELYLARGLYMAGDKKGEGAKILKQYANDLREHYSLFSRGILS